MAKRTRNATRRNSGTAPTPSPGATTADVIEQRVLAFAEQLGRIAGTVQAKTAGWMNDDALKEELARVRDGAADLLQQLTGGAAAVAKVRPATGVAAPRTSKGRSGGVVDAPGKKHRPRSPSDPDASRVGDQAAKMRAAKTMVKTNRLRGRG
jgi:hypothetical protein